MPKTSLRPKKRKKLIENYEKNRGKVLEHYEELPSDLKAKVQDLEKKHAKTKEKSKEREALAIEYGEIARTITLESIRDTMTLMNKIDYCLPFEQKTEIRKLEEEYEKTKEPEQREKVLEKYNKQFKQLQKDDNKKAYFNRLSAYEARQTQKAELKRQTFKKEAELKAAPTLAPTTPEQQPMPAAQNQTGMQFNSPVVYEAMCSAQVEMAKKEGRKLSYEIEDKGPQNTQITLRDEEGKPLVQIDHQQGQDARYISFDNKKSAKTTAQMMKTEQSLSQEEDKKAVVLEGDNDKLYQELKTKDPKTISPQVQPHQVYKKTPDGKENYYNNPDATRSLVDDQQRKRMVDAMERRRMESSRGG